MKKWTVYKIISPSGKVYIGKSSNYKKRISYYRNNNCMGQTRLSSSFIKHGFSSHTLEIIDSFHSDTGYANGKEMFWIRSYMSNFCKWPEMNGLNLTDGGEGTVGYKASEETRAKQSKSHIGLPGNRKGIKWTEEQKKHLSDYFTGRPNLKARGKFVSEETRSKLSKARIGKPAPNKGNKYSEEIIAKLRLIGWKPILQYSLSGEFIKEFPSIRAAESELGLPYSTIGSALRLSKNPRFFIFKYKNVS